MNTSQTKNQPPVLKVIAGIENFDQDTMQTLAKAADGKAHSIDIAVDQDMIQWIKANTQLSVFVSSLDPKALIQAEEWGTDYVELGNFQPIYDRGSLVSAEHVMTWTRELMSGLKGQAKVCITLPGLLTVEEQVALAKDIEALGADILQIENINGQLEHVLPIQNAVGIPVMLSGLLTPDTLSQALELGVDAVGVGSYIRKGETQLGMTQRIEQLNHAMSLQNV